MTLLAIFVAILVGAPVLLTVSALLAVVPFFLLGVIGVLVFKARDVFAQQELNTGNEQAGMDQAQFTPTMRFHLRRSSPPWNRKMRAN